MIATAQGPRISIAMATYNGARFLEEQFASLAGQSYLPAELIVVDDASSDGTREIIEIFVRSAPFPVIFSPSETRLGYRARFIEAASRCRCDLVAFCDQDDIWRDDKLAVLAQLFEDRDLLLAFHNARLIDKQGEPFGETFPKRRAQNFRPLDVQPFSIIPGFSQIVSGQLVKFASFHAISIDPLHANERMAHDQFFFFWASVFGNIRFVPAQLVDYRQHDGNVFGWHRAGRIADAVQDILITPSFLQSAAAGAANRHELLNRVRETGLCDAEQSVLAIGAMTYYDKLARDLLLRSNLYSSDRFIERIATFVRLLRSGGYTSAGSRSFGVGPIIMDLLIGLPFGRWLASLSSASGKGHDDARSANRKS